MAETLRQRWQRRIQAVLGAAVLAGGLGFGVATVGGTLVEAAAMSGWRPVEARLRQVRLVRHRDDGAVRFETRARYTYEVGGVTYRGRRIGLHDGPDDIGDYQRRLHAQLKRLKGNGQPVTVWVDPADPSRAVIDPKPRWELLGVRSAFSVIFAAMGAVLLLHARRRPSPAPDPAAADVAAAVQPDPDDRTLQVVSRPDGVWIRQPALRAPVMAMLLLVLGLGAGLLAGQLATAGLAAGWSKLPSAVLLPVVGAAVAGCFGGAAWTLGHARTVRAFDQGVEVWESLFGCPFRYRRYPVGTVDGLSVRSTMSASGVGTGTRHWYEVRLRSRGTGDARLADRITDRRLADGLVAAVERALGRGAPA